MYTPDTGDTRYDSALRVSLPGTGTNGYRPPLILPEVSGSARYNRSITPQPPAPVSARQTTALVLFWLTLAIAIAGVIGAWSNHFDNAFHEEDIRTIVNNPAIRDLGNLPKFFVDPSLFSTKQSEAAYQPVTSVVFTINRAIRGRVEHVLFHFQNFMWFCIEILLLYALCRLFPGARHYPALFTAVFFALHPLAANTVNDPVNLGAILGSVGLLAGLSIAIIWPTRMPADIDLGAPRVPKKEWDLIRLRAQPKVTRFYNRIRKRRLALYIAPVLLGILAFPATAIFAPLLALYMCLFEPAKRLRRVIPVAGICAGLWLLQAALTSRYTSSLRVGLLEYWFTQPLVVARAFVLFFVPVRFDAISTLLPVEHPWSLWALAGYAGTAVLILLALSLMGREAWRPVAFGLWWFLLASAVFAVIPQEHVETIPRMFFADIGLAVALSRVLQLAAGWVKNQKRGDYSFEMPAYALGLLLGVTVLSLLGAQTWAFNNTWHDDTSLWKYMVEKNPNDPVAQTRYASLMIAAAEDDFFGFRLDEAYASLKRVLPLNAHKEQMLTVLAQTADMKRLEKEPQAYLLQAIQANPAYAPAYAAYSRWLLKHGDVKQALVMAKKALDLDPTDIPSRAATVEAYVGISDWNRAISAADALLRLNPDSNDAIRSLQVAQAGLAARTTAETKATSTPSVDNYLNLSSVYFNEKRYDECIKAAQEALKLEPGIAEAYVNIASAYHMLGRREEGIAALREATRLRPDFDFAKNNLQWELTHGNTPTN